MRRIISGLLIATACLALGSRGDLIPAARAQSGAVKALFEKYNLLGNFAWVCSEPASKDNWYYVNRLVDADHVQRDRMTGPTTRSSVTIIDKATELKPNEIAFSGTNDGKPGDGVYHVEPSRLMQWEGTIAGERIIGEGKLLATGAEMKGLNKCDPLQPIHFNLAGQWKSQWGPVTIQAAANDSWSGSWVQNGGTGVLDKGAYDLRAGTLVFSTYQPWNKAIGTAFFKLSQDGRTLEGTWNLKRTNGSEDHGPWSLTR
jgi:hypothetical protein